MITLKITYKNGNELSQKINYLHIEDGKLFYTVDKNPHPVFQEPVSIPLENIKMLDVTAEGRKR